VSDRKYKFSWGLLGDMELGRPTLGPTMRLEPFRLAIGAMRDVLERSFGTANADNILIESGKLAGRHFFENALGKNKTTDFDQFVKLVQSVFISMRVGTFTLEESDLKSGSFLFAVAEDISYSGIADLKREIHKFEEGFIIGLLEGFADRKFQVKEVCCWSTDNAVRRFKANAAPKLERISASDGKRVFRWHFGSASTA